MELLRIMVTGVFVRIHSLPAQFPPPSKKKKIPKQGVGGRPFIWKSPEKQLWEQVKGGRQQRKASEVCTHEQVASEGCCLGSEQPLPSKRLPKTLLWISLPSNNIYPPKLCFYLIQVSFLTSGGLSLQVSNAWHPRAAQVQNRQVLRALGTVPKSWACWGGRMSSHTVTFPGRCRWTQRSRGLGLATDALFPACPEIVFQLKVILEMVFVS